MSIIYNLWKRIKCSLLFIIFICIFLEHFPFPYDLPLLVLLAFGIILIMFIVYYNKIFYYTILIMFLGLLWIVSLINGSISSNIGLFYLETILISLIMVGIGAFVIKVWESAAKELKECNKLLKGNPQDTMAWNNKGIHLTTQMKYLSALDCFDKVIELDPNDAAAWYNKGTLIKKENEQLSEKYLKKAQKLDPELKKSLNEGKLILDGS